MLTDKKALAEEERKRIEEEKEQMIPETGTCECPDRETDQSLREKEASSAIEFEDALHNQVYIKRKPKKKRDVSEMSFILSRKTKSLDRDQVKHRSISSKSVYSVSIRLANVVSSFVRPCCKIAFIVV